MEDLTRTVAADAEPNDLDIHWSQDLPAIAAAAQALGADYAARVERTIFQCSVLAMLWEQLDAGGGGGRRGKWKYAGGGGGSGAYGGVYDGHDGSDVYTASEADSGAYPDGAGTYHEGAWYAGGGEASDDDVCSDDYASDDDASDEGASDGGSGDALFAAATAAPAAVAAATAASSVLRRDASDSNRACRNHHHHHHCVCGCTRSCGGGGGGGSVRRRWRRCCLPHARCRHRWHAEQQLASGGPRQHILVPCRCDAALAAAAHETTPTAAAASPMVAGDAGAHRMVLRDAAPLATRGGATWPTAWNLRGM